MPYIKQVNRPFYKKPILGILEVIPAMTDSPTLERMKTKGRWFKAFLELVLQNYTSESSEMDASLRRHTDVIRSGYIRSEHPGDLNYALSATLWGLLGDHPKHPLGDYALRTYCRGVLERTLHWFPHDRQESDFSFVVTGVIGDVVDECYRRRTADYEDSKIEQEGDLWKNGELI